jgi:hypothetical protein
MTFRRISLIAGIAVLTAFVIVVVARGHDGGNALVIALALIVLIGAGNLLYGRGSHGAAQARTGPAQEARNRAIDEARRREAGEAQAEAQARDGATAPAEDDDAPRR